MAAKLLPQRSTTERFDDDGRTNRTGTVRTASAHIITAVIGSGVLTLPWAMAQLGWLAGITALLMFCIITWFCTTLQADCYRYPDPVTGARNYTYMDAVRSNLGKIRNSIFHFSSSCVDFRGARPVAGRHLFAFLRREQPPPPGPSPRAAFSALLPLRHDLKVLTFRIRAASRFQAQWVPSVRPPPHRSEHLSPTPTDSVCGDASPAPPAGCTLLLLLCSIAASAALTRRTSLDQREVGLALPSLRFRWLRRRGRGREGFHPLCQPSNQGGVNVQMCGLVQNMKFVGVAIGYVITASLSIAAVKRSNCFHKNGHEAACTEPISAYMMIFAAIEIVLSQLPNFHKIWWLSYIAAATSFAYASIGVGLTIAKIAEDGVARTSITGVEIGVDVSGSEKVWRTFQALGNIAVAYSFALILIEIQDTLKSSPPENKVMKKASFLALFTTTVFFMLCSTCGYAAFGNNAPGNFLTGFGVYEPFWLIDIANICIVIHLVGAYQVFNQPLFQFVENWSRKHWPDQIFLMAEHTITIPLWGNFTVSFFRVIWRTLYVILTTTVAMMFPFFNSFLGLLGALGFWPLTVYFPVEMYISQAEIQRFSAVWIMLRLLSLACLLVSLAAACGSIQGIVSQLIGQSSLKFRGQTELQPTWREYL